MSSLSSSQIDHESARSQATRVTIVGMILDLLLALGKIAGGAATQSFALITDGIHSLTDAISDVFVLLVARIAHTGPDQEHPYGHGRFETIGTIAMGILFFTTAGILLYDSSIRLRQAEMLPTPATAGLLIAALSIASKEWIYHYTMRVARRLDSSLLKANAWHSRSDAISSIAVLIGIFAAQQGYAWMDTVAGVFVSLIIAKVGWELCSDSLKELVDTAVPAQRKQQIQQSILAVDGVRGITSIRTRSSGGKIILELRLLVDPRISVSEGHEIGEQVSRSLTGSYSDIGDVTIHIDPVDYHPAIERSHEPVLLPPREEVSSALRAVWQQWLSDDDIDKLVLHYIDEGIEVELVLREGISDIRMLENVRNATADFDHIVRLEILSKLLESDQLGPLS